MANYLLLYYDGTSTQTDKQRQQKQIDWEEHEIGNALVDNGATADVAAVKVEDEITTLESNHLQGYSIIKASSLSQALEISSGAPVLKEGGKVAVYKTDRTGN